MLGFEVRLESSCVVCEEDTRLARIRCQLMFASQVIIQVSEVIE